MHVPQFPPPPQFITLPQSPYRSAFSSRSASLQLSPLSVLNCCWPWGVCTCTSICGEAETVMAHRLGLYGGWDLIGGLRHVASAVFGTIPAAESIPDFYLSLRIRKECLPRIACNC
eukprot:CAMPEP_0202410044 /NCGR_PEP_ID=MMETSP1128-20130828/18275_1 /ASSEMBLY_ACC=CAM_ASM_000463 /TAXON_ID=3047 /ORGANISM="Dunaliella tertiolecta, Strain CCMP1320" /LENGTH=115 /DNA_ID=CAMNT_0049015485 /DNA_START=671 /DNA_END=1015 /DNA_ORIENTATION=-